MNPEPSRTDLHSHLVPGVDDGAETVVDVLDGVARMQRHGIGTIATTPHLAASLTLRPAEFSDRMDEMDRAFQDAATAVRERFGGLAFSRSNEVALDHPEPDLSDPRLRLGQGPFMLVEWARFQAPPESGRVLERLREQGIAPVLAHPERYRRAGPSFAAIGSWKEAGAVFQMNYGSLAGAYGSDVREMAVGLLARGWVDCLSTDFHGRASLSLFIDPAREVFERREDGHGAAERAWELLTSTNPARILRGEDPLPVPALPTDASLWDRVASLFR